MSPCRHVMREENFWRRRRAAHSISGYPVARGSVRDGLDVKSFQNFPSWNRNNIFSAWSVSSLQVWRSFIEAVTPLQHFKLDKLTEKVVPSAYIP